jgi:hypothetical protein
MPRQSKDGIVKAGRCGCWPIGVWVGLITMVEFVSGAIIVPDDKSKNSVIHASVKEIQWQASPYHGLPMIPL